MPARCVHCNTSTPHWRCLLLALILVIPAAFGDTPLPKTIVFNRDIRPILSENCFHCHGPDRNTRKAGLRLDVEAEALKDLGGYRALVPGKPDQSELFQRITTLDEDDLMPPPKSGLKLTSREKELLRRWIEQGATWQAHWSFLPPVSAPPPKTNLKKWARNPMDQFVLARLEQEGLKPSPEADRTTLIRRVTLDLTGLPPKPSEVEAFLKDKSPKAYEKVVERLLQAPHYGERMALPWLDAARYADTHGYQKDNERSMWAWRDWVIQSFNDNMPFDLFTIEQLAGDLLPNATLSQKIATGFNRNHRINAEAGSIEEEFLAEYAADRVDTTSMVWLGLTVACARCHDHKFDPISQKDYYRLFAFFNNVAEKGVDGVGPSPAPQLAVPLPGYENAIARAEKRLAELTDQWQASPESLHTERTRWEKELSGKISGVNGTPVWSLASPTEIVSAEGTKFERLEDLSILGHGPNPLNDVHTVTIPFDDGTLNAVRLEALTHESHENGSLARSFDGNFVLSGFEVELVPSNAPPQRAVIGSAVADYSQPHWPVTAAIDDDHNNGWAVDGGTKRENRTALFILKESLSGSPGAVLKVRLRYQSKEEQSIIGRFRLATISHSNPSLEINEALPATVIAALKTSPTRRTEAQHEAIDAHFRAVAPVLAPVRAKVLAAREELAKLRRASVTSVMVMQELEQPRETFILERGLYDKHGEAVTPGVPSSLPALKTSSRATRLDFARWLVSPENPLTARVAVNRFWQMYFGTGLVKTAEDFGTQGEWPSHPELLDWLATEFIRSGWDVKAMQRLIVTSATYRQSSRVSAELLERDPENRLLARGPRLRLPAQFIRDQALAATGLLVPKIGGPPVKPYQPEGIWSAVAGINSNTTKYHQDTGEKLYRRSLYTFWKRAVPPPNMMVFDAADREVCSVQRKVTNTPLQALTLLNDVMFVEAARALAEQILSQPNRSTEQRIQNAWSRVLARKPSIGELNQLTRGFADYQSHFRQSPEAAMQLIETGESVANPHLDPTTLAAWTTVAAVILNLDETLTKE